MVAVKSTQGRLMNHRIRVIGSFASMLAWFAAGPAHAAALPDLYLSDVQYLGGVYSGSCNLIRVTVRNGQNVGVSAPIVVELVEPIEGGTLTQTLPNGIGPGGSAPVHFYWYPTPFTLYVDPRNAIAETNESNNTLAYSQAGASGGPCPKVSLVKPLEQKVAEGGVATFDVRLDRTFVRPVEVQWRAISDTAKVGRSCWSRGADAAGSGTVSFAPGTVGPQKISVAVCNDSMIEGDEQFRVGLFRPINAELNSQLREAVVTIPGQAAKLRR